MPRPRIHLTDAAVKRLPIPTLPANVPKKAMGSAMRDYFDRDVTGFHVRCSPSGRKTFALAYSMRDTGTRRRFIIGDYPALTAEDARTLARQRLNEVASGIDPQAVRDQKRVTAAHTVTQMADTFLAVRQIKDSTRGLYGSLFRLHILPKLGACAVADVTTDDIARMHAKLHTHKTTADQCVRLLATLFRYAEKSGARVKGTNPATDVDRYGENLKERYLQPHELAALIRALDTAETSGLPAAPERQRKVNPKTAKHAPPPTPGKQNVARGTVLRANPTAVAFEPVRLDQLIEDVVEDCRLDATERGCRIEFDSQTAMTVKGNAELLRRAIENALRNAVRYSPAGDAVLVGLSARGGRVRVDILDRGPGVPPEALPHLFDAFYRVAQTGPDAGKGYGLGLSIARRAVELHNGTIEAVNKYPGFNVTITLPAAT